MNKYTDQIKTNRTRHISSIDRRSIGGNRYVYNVSDLCLKKCDKNIY